MNVAEAQAAVDAAAARVKELQAELRAAEQARMSAISELRDAKVRADDVLPRARMVTTEWRNAKGISEEVVVAKRTAKQITVRRPGDDHEFMFRQDSSGTWRRYPRPQGFFSTYVTLEIDR